MFCEQRFYAPASEGHSPPQIVNSGCKTTIVLVKGGEGDSNKRSMCFNPRNTQSMDPIHLQLLLHGRTTDGSNSSTIPFR